MIVKKSTKDIFALPIGKADFYGFANRNKLIRNGDAYELSFREI